MDSDESRQQTKEQLDETASKAEAALRRLDIEYKQLDSSEEKFLEILDRLQQDEKSLEAALLSSSSPLKISKKKELQAAALARLESALMMEESSSSSSEEEQTSHVDQHGKRDGDILSDFS